MSSYYFSKRDVSCTLCGTTVTVAYESPIYDLTETCQTCAPVREKAPDIYEWIHKVITYNQSIVNKGKVEDIIEERLNPTRGYY